MKHLSTRASVTARTGQNLAPRVGPYAYYYRLFEDFYEIVQMEYDKLLTQEEYLNDHKFRLIIVPDPPAEPRYTNNALYVVPARATDTSEEYDSDVSQKGLRNILVNFRTSSEEEDSDEGPKYSPTGQCYSSDNESDDASDSESDSESHQDDQLASDSDVEILS
jgi:hypothetical protein